MNKNNLIILITGGVGILGRKMADYLHNQGNEIYVFDKIPKGGIESSFIKGLSGYFECDLSKPEEIEACFDELIKQTKRIDVLINNASVRQFKNLGDFQTIDVSKNLSVDFIAPVILINLCLTIMKKNSFGRIISISSISAYRGYSKGSLYCSSKRALIAINESLSKELKKFDGTITSNIICPGSFSKSDGTILLGKSFITDSVLTKVNYIIHSKINGRTLNVFSFRYKLMESLRFLKRAVQMLIR